MDFSKLLDLAGGLGIVISLSLFFFFYFRNASFRERVGSVIVFLPALAGFVANKVEDTPGVFDTHDALIVLCRISQRIHATIDDPTNKVFEDVQEEVFDIVRDELAEYKGLPGVPDLDDPMIQVQVRVVFEGIQRAASEDSA